MPWSSRIGLASLGVAALAIASCLLACGLVVSFDEYGKVAPRPLTPDAGPSHYAVRGTISGLDGARTTIALNGTALEVGEGPFAFPSELANGAEFTVTVSPIPKHECSVLHGQGTIAGVDVSDVAITCVSTDATLASLVTSAGPLSPAFAPGTLAYRVRGRAHGFLPGGLPTQPITPAVLTATTTRAGAKITIDGVSVAAGTPSNPFALELGENAPIDIAVTSPDGKRLLHYTLKTSVERHDYLKPPPGHAEALVSQQGLALSGDTLAAAGFDGVYLFRRPTAFWSHEAFINLPLTSSSSIALDGDTLAVGVAHGVEVFVRAAGSWSKKASFDLPLAASTRGAVAIKGDTLAFGTCTETDGPSAYVFARSGTTWSLASHLLPVNLPAGDRCSVPAHGPILTPVSIAISGDRIALGVAADSSAAAGVNGNPNDTSLSGAGAVHVFVRNGASWSQEAYLKASIPQELASFGGAVAFSGATLVAGAPGETTNTGAAYVFERSAAGWTEVARLKVFQPNASFGIDVALAGDILAVGAPGYDSFDVPYPGAVFAYQRTNPSGASWSSYASVGAPTPHSYAAFGTTVALSADALCAGVPYHTSQATGVNGEERVLDGIGTSQGAVYVF